MFIQSKAFMLYFRISLKKVEISFAYEKVWLKYQTEMVKIELSLSPFLPVCTLLSLSNFK